MNLLFFDVDGTLLEFSRGIREVDPLLKHAFQVLRQRGDQYFIASGRAYGALPRSILELDPNGYSLCAGAYVNLRGREVRNEYFPADVLDFVLGRLDLVPAIQYLEVGQKLYMNQFGVEEGRLFNEKFGVPQENIQPLADPRSLKVNKLSVKFLSLEDSEIMADFARYGLRIQGQPSPGAFDITMDRCTKREGILAVRNALDPEGKCKVYAFGDSYNDLEMIRYADVGVAMGNAPEELRQAADYVTTSVEENGVYHALKELKLL